MLRLITAISDVTKLKRWIWHPVKVFAFEKVLDEDDYPETVRSVPNNDQNASSGENRDRWKAPYYHHLDYEKYPANSSFQEAQQQSIFLIEIMVTDVIPGTIF